MVDFNVRVGPGKRFFFYILRESSKKFVVKLDEYVTETERKERFSIPLRDLNPDTPDYRFIVCSPSGQFMVMTEKEFDSNQPISFILIVGSHDKVLGDVITFTIEFPDGNAIMFFAPILGKQ